MNVLMYPRCRGLVIPSFCEKCFTMIGCKMSLAAALQHHQDKAVSHYRPGTERLKSTS